MKALVMNVSGLVELVNVPDDENIRFRWCQGAGRR